MQMVDYLSSKPKPKGLKFEEVLPALREGKQVTRVYWNRGSWLEKSKVRDSNLIYLCYSDGSKQLADDMFFNHIMAEDWEILD